MLNKFTIINVTAHPITFYDEVDDTLFTVEPCGFVASATVSEIPVASLDDGIEIVKPGFGSDLDTLRELLRMQKPYTIIVGSLIAAQAYPGVVYGMVPTIGFERVPEGMKRMNPRKFNCY